MFNQVFLKAYQRDPRQNDANITFYLWENK